MFHVLEPLTTELCVKAQRQLLFLASVKLHYSQKPHFLKSEANLTVCKQTRVLTTRSKNTAGEVSGNQTCLIRLTYHGSAKEQVDIEQKNKNPT